MSGGDYVFRQTRLGGLEYVGDFDGLYQNENDPWNQSAKSGEMGEYYQYSRSQLVKILQGLNLPEDAIGLEVGCGHGHLTCRLTEDVCLFMGMDVSEVAVKKASQLYPELLFDVGDVRSPLIQYQNQFDVIVWGQILWYVMHDLSHAVHNSLRALQVGGFLVVSQAFLRNQRYGRQVFDGFGGAVQVLSSIVGTQLVHAQYDFTEQYVHHDGVIVLRRKV